MTEAAVQLEATWSMLRRSFGRGPAALPLAVWCADIASWLEHGRLKALSFEKRTLAAEHVAAISAVGARLRRRVRSPLDEFDAAVAATLVRQPAAADVTTALTAAERLGTALRHPKARQAAWTDVLTVSTRARSLEDARGRVAQLRAVLHLAGFDADDRIGRLTRILADDKNDVISAQVALGRRRPPGRWPAARATANMGAQDRLALCSDFVGVEAKRTAATIWLAYRRARLTADVLEVGNVTFVRLEHAHQLAAGGHSLLGTKLDDADDLPLLVDDDDLALVRIQFDDHLPRDAVDDAVALVAAMTGDIAADAIGTSWRQIGWSNVSFGSGGGGTSGFTMPEQLADIRRSYDHERTARRLAERADRVAQALQRRRPFDRLLADALRARAEASSMTSVRNEILLFSRAAEAAASSAGLDGLDPLRDFAIAEWPWSVIRGDIMHAAALATGRDDLSFRHLPGLSELAGKLFADEKVTWTYRLDLGAVVTNRAELLALADGPVETRNNRQLVRLLTDPKAHLDRVGLLAADAQLLADRARRVRNAIAHGNPITEHVLESARDFWSYLADVAVHVATGRYGATGAGQDAIDAMTQSRSSYETALRAGRRPIDAYEEVERPENT